MAHKKGMYPSNPLSVEETRLLLRPVSTEWPLRPECHGKSITRFTVGSPPQANMFTIHTNLLTSASRPLAEKYRAMYGKSPNVQEWLQWQPTGCEPLHPRAFEVFYQYLYTGQVYQPSHYTMGPTSSEGYLWYKLYHLGTALSVPVMEQIAFQKLCAMFNPAHCKVPNIDLITELSHHDCPQVIGEYISGHAAWWMTKDTATLTLWTPLLQSDAPFGRQVALLLARHGLDPDFRHPWQQLIG